MKNVNLLSRVGTGSRSTYCYRLCGWQTDSDIPLTSIRTSIRDSEHGDVVIRIAHGESPVARSDKSYWARVEHSIGRSLVGITNVADFEVRNGKEISVWPAAGATKNDVEIVLFGPVWAALCHQRSILPLHASAIDTKRGIAAFAGVSGSGKSTIAAIMGSCGYKLITDDILPVSFNQKGAPGAWPYLRRLKLKDDSITPLALTPAGRVSETLDEDKYFVVPKFIADDRWRDLERLYLLETDPTASRLSIKKISGLEAICVLIDQTYHFDFVRDSGEVGDHLAFCIKLASQIAIYRLRRPPSLCVEKEFGLQICEHLETEVTDL